MLRIVFAVYFTLLHIAEHAANQRIMLYYKDAVMFPMFCGIMLKSANGINEVYSFVSSRGQVDLNSIGHLQMSGKVKSLVIQLRRKRTLHKSKSTVFAPFLFRLFSIGM